MKLVYSDYFLTKLRKRVKKKSQLDYKIRKQLHLLVVDPKHPGLKLHKLKGKRSEEYSIWIEGNTRVTFILIKDSCLLTDFIKHDQY